MKLIFLVNSASFLSEFFGKLAHQAMEQGDECLVVTSNKIADYEKRKFFPDKIRFISKVDWCVDNYKYYKEKRNFGGLSWKEFFPAFDRFKSLDFRYKNSFNMISNVYHFLDYIFQKEKPDMIICEPPAGFFHEVAYYFCNNNNVPYIGLNDSLHEGKIDIFDAEFTSLKYERIFNEIKDADIIEKERKFAKDFIEKLVSHKKVHSYVGLVKIHFTQFGLINHYIERIKELKPLLRYVLNRKYLKDFDYEGEDTFRILLSSPWRMEKRQFRILSQKNIFSISVDKNDNFFLFPLHFQPETSTSIWATYYCDQLNTIKNISFALPFPYKLYVKEHPASVGLRSRGFYRELQKLPNVVLISPDENVENLVKKSVGIITLTSTIGMEAALVGKPVYVLGNVFYSYHPLCRKVRNFEELKDRINEDLAVRQDLKDLENINCRFIVSCLRNTIEGSVVSASQEKDINNYQMIYQNLKFYAKQ